MNNIDILELGQKLEIIHLKKSRDVKYLSYIKDMNTNLLLIDVPSLAGKNYVISANEIIKVIITTENAVYSFNTIVKKNQLSPIVGLWILEPKSIERVQRRKYLRIKVNIDLEMKMIDKDGDILHVSNTMSDISGGGISIYTNEDLKQYVNKGKFIVRFSLPEEEEEIVTEVDLVFAKDLQDNKNKQTTHYNYFFAFKFLDIDEKTIDRICKFCFQYQIELKRKGLI